tara:strand:+ start:776 stop:967 length:192 start_codon:yes stop_codon:yes gene_type:complete
MFKNISSFVIKFKGTIEIIPKINKNINLQTTKNKPKYNKKNTPGSFVECDDEYIKKIIKNGGL